MNRITRRGLSAGLLAAVAVRRPSMAADRPIPPEGIGHRIKHLSYSDQGGRPDGVQVMVNRKHVYVGHMFSDGITVMDAADPRKLKPVGFWSAGPTTRTHHIQVAEDTMLVANGASIPALKTFSTMTSYYSNGPAGGANEKRTFRSGLSIHDISKPAEMREIAFLEMPGFGINRLWWTGGRYAYVSAHFDGFSDHILCIVDLKNIAKPEIVSKWWLPGMNTAAGEARVAPQGRRWALHHMIVAGDRGYAAWRDGGLTIHDVGDPTAPKLLSRINWNPPDPGGTHTPLPLPNRKLAVVCNESNAENCAKGVFHTWVVDVQAGDNPIPVSTMPTPAERDFCKLGNFGPHNLHENRPGSFVSEETIFATYHNAGLRVFDIKNAYEPKEVAYWVPPIPKKLLDPRPGVSLAAQSCDAYVQKDGIIYLSDWNAGMHVLEYKG